MGGIEEEGLVINNYIQKIVVFSQYGVSRGLQNEFLYPATKLKCHGKTEGKQLKQPLSLP